MAGRLLYNGLGQKTGEKDQAGFLTQFGYDILGMLTNVIKPEVYDPETDSNRSPAWSYVYDAYGRLTVTVDPKGRGTTNTYDALGREIARSLPLGQTTSNVYNDKGQLWQQFDFKGQKTELVYDRFGRVKAKFRFDAGSLYPSNAICYQYNQLGQLSGIIERYGVDANTNACDGYASIVGPIHVGGASLTERVAQIISKFTPFAVGFAVFALVMVWAPGAREARRLLAKFYLRGGWRTDPETAGDPCRQFRGSLRLPSVFWRFVTITTVIALLGCDPSFDRLWNASAACTIPSNASTETTRITNFAYDVEGRLTQLNCPEGVINYEYDLVTGRQTRTCTSNSEMEYGYDALGRLKTVTVLKRNGVALAIPEITTYTYTKVGSREKVTLPNGVVTSYKYDSLNRLTNLVHQLGTTNLATYDYQLHLTGRRTGATEILRQEDGTYLTNTLAWKYDGLYRLTNEVSVSSVPGGTYTNLYFYDLAGNRVKRINTAGTTVTTVTNVYDANDQLTREVTLVNGAPTQTKKAMGSHLNI